VVVKRAAERASTAEQFVDQVLAACPELDGRQLRRDLLGG